MNAAQPEMQEKQFSVFQLRCKIHIKVAAEMRQPDGHPHLLTMRIQSGDKFARARIHLLLQGRTLSFQMQQHRPRCRQRQRVPDKCPRKKCHTHLGSGVVPILPVPSIQRIHEFALSRHHSNRQPAADDFSISRNVRLNPKPPRRTARMNAEAIDYFIKNQCDAALLRNAAQFMQKLGRLQLGTPALHRFHEHAGNFRGMPPDDFKRLRIVIIQHQNILPHGLGYAWRNWNGLQFVTLQHRPHQHLIHDAMVGPRKHHQLVASSHRPRHPDRRHDRLAPGVTKTHPIQSSKFQKQFRHLAHQRRRGTDFHAALQLRLHRLHHKRRAVSKKAHPESLCDVDKFISIHIPNSPTLGTVHHQRIDRLLPQMVEPRHSARISEMMTMPGCELFGFPGLFHIRRHEVIQMLALRAGERAILRNLQGTKRPEGNRAIGIDPLGEGFDTIPPLLLDNSGPKFGDRAFDQCQPLSNRTWHFHPRQTSGHLRWLRPKGPRRQLRVQIRRQCLQAVQLLRHLAECDLHAEMFF